MLVLIAHEEEDMLDENDERDENRDGEVKLTCDKAVIKLLELGEVTDVL